MTTVFKNFAAISLSEKISTFNVDMNSVSDLKKHITLLQKRRKKLLREAGVMVGTLGENNKYNASVLFPVLDSIFNSDISSIYSSDDERKYYVYAHCYEDFDARDSDLRLVFLSTKFPNLNKKPFYIGKGTGERINHIERNGVHKKILSKISAEKITKVVLADNLTEAEALQLESKIIDILGLRALSKNGFLSNLDEGKSYKERRKLYFQGQVTKNIQRFFKFVWNTDVQI